ncbi:hypothetical protein ACFW9N_39095 [Streptomyces sp. NPDC059496]|uniref:hypothetical protein n=1 Tax=Streptomyces sp. NPDC059496 TaxID=3346851 RepID=UPI00368E99C7
MSAGPRHYSLKRLRNSARSDLHYQAVAAPGGEPELVVEYRDGEFTVRPPAPRLPAT